MWHVFKDLTGKRFGSLVCLRRGPNYTWKNQICVQWLCRCTCGREYLVRRCNLTNRVTRNCGCKRAKQLRKRVWKGHKGLSGTTWQRIRKSARARNLILAITIEQIWRLFLSQNKRCDLTGQKLILDKKTRKGNDIKQTASLDRIDPKDGYKIENVRWIHKLLNHMKKDMTDEELFYWCELVVKHDTKKKRAKKNASV